MSKEVDFTSLGVEAQAVGGVMQGGKASPFSNLRTIPELATNPMSYNEWVVGHRIQDSLTRQLPTLGANAPRTVAYVHFKNDILTVDLSVGDKIHRRIVLGADNKATFMDYDAAAQYGRKITVAPHFCANRDENNLEDILIQTKTFATDAQKRIS